MGNMLKIQGVGVDDWHRHTEHRYMYMIKTVSRQT